MANEDPIFNLADDEQWNRIASHFAACRRDAVAAKSAGKKSGYIFRVSIKRVRNLRTTQQNAYYWGVVLPYLAEAVRRVNGEGDADYNSEDAHEDCKQRFLTRNLISRDGEWLGSKRRSTTVLDTVEFYDYVEKIRQLSADLGVPVPPPERIFDGQYPKALKGNRINIDERPVSND
jgi:hypothetical protein